MKNMGIYVGKEKNAMRLGFCSKSGDIIELMLRPQWWVDCQDVALKCINSIRTRKLVIKPKEYTKNWYYWLQNIKDWCISR